jgi:hypothetical protein
MLRTLQQVVGARPTADYDTRYGAAGAVDDWRFYRSGLSDRERAGARSLALAAGDDVSWWMGKPLGGPYAHSTITVMGAVASVRPAPITNAVRPAWPHRSREH